MKEISLSEYTQRPQPNKKPIFSQRNSMFAVGLVAVVAISFFSGVQYQKSKGSTAIASRTASAYQNRFEGGFRQGPSNRAFGTVTAISSSSISIQTRGGSTNTYTLTNSTVVMDNGQTSSVNNVQTGDTVILALDNSSSKDVTSIMLNPNFGGFGGGFSAPSTGSNTGGSTGGSSTGSSTSASGA